MNRTQMEMVLYLLLLGACLVVIFVTALRRYRGNKTPYDFIILICSTVCIIIGGIFGVMMT